MTPLETWLLAFTLAAAHDLEPKNTAPKPAPAALVASMVKATTHASELGRLAVYAFLEGSYSTDPELPGDCEIPPAYPCVASRKPRSWCTLQVHPKPSTLDECIAKGLATMRYAIAKCPTFPMALYTWGRCGYSHSASWREHEIEKLLLANPVTP